MTALGRLDCGIDQALSRRYATPALVFWACALILTVVRVRDSSWLASQPRRRSALALAALVAVLSRELDPEVLGEVSPFDMSYMERRIGFLERQGWSVFSTFDGRVLESGSAPSE